MGDDAVAAVGIAGKRRPGIEQQVVARRLHMDRQALPDIEHGDCRPALARPRRFERQQRQEGQQPQPAVRKTTRQQRPRAARQRQQVL